MWAALLVFILFTLIFVFAMVEQANIDRCPYEGGKCFDGNGQYQYKGRGCANDPVGILLSRIDWLAEKSNHKPLYSIGYIISYAILLAIIIIAYAFHCYFLSAWEMIIYIFAAFIIAFSILNLFNFHTDRYPIYYTRENVKYIADKLNIYLPETPNPCPKSSIPHRTKVRDVLNW